MKIINALLATSVALLMTISASAQDSFDLSRTESGDLFPTYVDTVTPYDGQFWGFDNGINAHILDLFTPSAKTLYTTMQRDANGMDLIIFADYKLLSWDAWGKGTAADMDISISGLTNPELIKINTSKKDELIDTGSGIQLQAYHARLDNNDLFVMNNMQVEDALWSIDISLNSYDSKYISDWQYITFNDSCCCSVDTIDLGIEENLTISIAPGLQANIVPEPKTLGMLACCTLFSFLLIRSRKH